ncbi:unnamed protein product [Owenia fusiformis]|uniref:Uncharacterized protein n=1 Tax=Owenia fusiformis TaxID=6347 RepID=A0A8J1UHG6_OWEFU|nr:unnamed protein product [Owenia fusiformis]
MLSLSTTGIIGIPLFVILYLIYRRMPKAGSPLFRLGYMLYTRTKVGYFYHRRELAKARQKYDDGHSVAQMAEFDGLRIIPIPIIMDNYCYLIVDDRTQTGILVDPADPDLILPVLKKESVNIVAVLCTHKHWDHSGGNSTFKRLYSNIKIYGGAVDRAQAVTHPVADGDVLDFSGLKFTVNFTPGHTVGHVVYTLNGAPFNAPDSLFSGDHLFLAGCGRMFEGSSTTMLRSLDVLCAMKDDTLVWPGHEYAKDNLEFCLTIEPNNDATMAKKAWVTEQRKNRISTCPSTIGEERRYNVFLRTGESSIWETLGLDNDTESERDTIRVKALSLLRQRKDKFKYKL